MKKRKTIGEPLPAPNKTRPSDVVAIPLGADFFGYARVCEGTFLQVLDKTTKGVATLQEVVGTKIKFFIEFYEPYDESPWIYLGKWPFESEEEAWGPPVWFGVPFRYISERGSHRQVPVEETAGVMKQQLEHPDEIVDRVVDAFALAIPTVQRSRIKQSQPIQCATDNDGAVPRRV